MSAEITGGKQLSARLRAIDDGRKLLMRLQLATTYEAKKLVPRKTGNLGRSIAPGSLTSHHALVHARANYAAYVERGTKPHVIMPRRGSVLRFPGSGVSTTLGGRVRTGEVRRLGAGAYVFAGKVNHPGTKPKPFLLPGAQTATRKQGVPIIVDLWNRAA